MQKETLHPGQLTRIPSLLKAVSAKRNVDVEAVRHRKRYRRILRFFGGVIAQFIVLDLLLGRIPLVGQRIRASRTQRLRRIARRFRALAVEMGGVQIKLGQFLSARVDVLPVEITEELAGLQDEVPAVAWPAIAAALSRELDQLQGDFVDIEQQPLAAASLGQAHRARLQTQTSLQEVVIKVQRPGIDRIVRTDLDALRVVAGWVMRYKPIRRRANVPALMEEFAHTLWEELDYHAEAKNAERFAELFADDDDIRVPKVYHTHSTGRVLTLENVAGLRIDDVAGITAAGISPTEVAQRLLDVYFQQVFQAGFFHADPHPGNIFIHALPRSADAPTDAPTPFQITFIDFGMMGNIQDVMSDNLQRILLAVARRDTQELTAIYSDMGFFLPSADLDRITEAQDAVLERIWGRSLQEMAKPNPDDIRELSNEFKDLLRTFPFQIPQDFIYLGRATGMLSGLTSRLHPDVNLWAQMEKYALEIVGDERLNLFDLTLIREEIQSLLAVPNQLRRLIKLAETGELQVRMGQDATTARRFERLERSVLQLNSTVLTSVLLLGGVLLYNGEHVMVAVGFWIVAGWLLLSSRIES